LKVTLSKSMPIASNNGNWTPTTPPGTARTTWTFTRTQAVAPGAVSSGLVGVVTDNSANTPTGQWTASATV
jgi:hypothetical protein